MSFQKLIKASLFTPGSHGWGLPLLFWGPPGGGKTDRIESEAARWNLRVKVLSPGELGDGAFGVTPVPQMREVQTDAGLTKQMVMTYPAPDWLCYFNDSNDEDSEPCGVIFIDEINRGGPMIQACLLAMIQARRVGGVPVGRRIRIIGAANPAETTSDVFEIDSAVANRLGHYNVESPDVDEWSAWLLGNESHADEDKVVDASIEEARVMSLWSAEYAKAKGSVASFLKRRPNLLHQQPAANDPQRSRGWPSPRSWDHAIRAKASAKIHGLSDDETMEFIGGFIGRGALIELLAYEHTMDIPDLEGVLDEKIKWQPSGERLDLTMAVLSGCTAMVCSPVPPAFAQRHAARLNVLWKLLDATADIAQDIAVLNMEVLAKRNDLMTGPHFVAALGKVHGVMKLSGRVK